MLERHVCNWCLNELEGEINHQKGDNDQFPPKEKTLLICNECIDKLAIENGVTIVDNLD